MFFMLFNFVFMIHFDEFYFLWTTYFMLYYFFKKLNKYYWYICEILLSALNFILVWVE